MASIASLGGWSNLDLSGVLANAESQPLVLPQRQQDTSNHDEICSFLMPQLATLGEALKSLKRQQSLHKAYGQTDDAPL